MIDDAAAQPILNREYHVCYIQEDFDEYWSKVSL